MIVLSSNSNKRFYNPWASEKEAIYRPLGIILITLMLVIFGVIGFTLGIINLAKSDVTYMYYYSSWVYVVYLVLSAPDLLIEQAAAFLIEFTPLIERAIAGLSAFWVGIFLFFVYLPASYGLIFMKKWGWYIGLIAGIVSIIIGIYLLALASISYIIFVFGIVILVYLLGSVKYAFEKSDVEIVLKNLNQGTISDRLRAVKLLEFIIEERVFESLLETLNDSDSRVRAEAARVLGRLGEERAFDPLLPVLNDKNIKVRKTAGQALTQIIKNKTSFIKRKLHQRKLHHRNKIIRQ